MRLLDGPELGHQRVELGIGDDRVVEDEVALGVVLDLLAQPGRTSDGILGRRAGHRVGR